MKTATMCRSPPRQFRFSMDRMKTPNRLLYALRYFIGVALPFIFFWVAVEKVFGGQSYRALACLGAAVLSFVVAVYWHRIIPARFLRSKSRNEPTPIRLVAGLASLVAGKRTPTLPLASEREPRPKVAP